MPVVGRQASTNSVIVESTQNLAMFYFLIALKFTFCFKRLSGGSSMKKLVGQVALWAWDIVVDNCAICRNHIMDLCKFLSIIIICI